MLNLDETFEVVNDYNSERDLIIRCFLYSIGVIVIVEILREQVPEINLLQLIPGFYLIFLFSTFLFFTIFSDFFVRVPYFIENKKSFGIKTKAKISLSSTLSQGLLLCIGTYFLSTLSVIPLSLDSFNSYGEKTLENIWSFDEVIGLETFLGIILFLLSQFPILILSNFTGESDVKQLQQFWRAISLSTFIISGFATPTIDGYTQLSFSGFSLSFYLLIILFLFKRSISRFNGNITLGF